MKTQENRKVNMSNNEEENKKITPRDDALPPAGYDDTGIKNSIKDLQKSLGKLGNLSGDIDKLKSDLENFKKEIKAQINTEVANMKAEMQKQAQQQQQQMQQMKDNLSKWYNHLTYNGSYDAGIPKV